MPKILFIDPQSYNNLSLYDSGVLSCMNGLDVTFFGSSHWDCEPMEGIEMNLWFNYNSYTNPIRKGISYLKSLLRIANYIRSRKVDIVHIQWLRNWQLDWRFLKFLKGRGIKVIFTAHNILPHDSDTRFLEQYRKYYHTVDKIIVHSRRTKQELIELFGIPEDKVTVIPHGILQFRHDSKELSSKIAELTEKYGLKGKLIFSSLGGQTFYKGVDNIVKVWSGTPELRENPDIRLLLVGKNSGIDYTPLAGIPNVVIVDEFIPNLDFEAFIKISDVILLPYRKISQSGVLFCALDNDIPVAVSDAGGLAEPLSFGEIGWNIGNPNPDNLRKLLVDLVSHPEKVEKTASREFEFNKVKRVYSWDTISQSTAELYRSI